MVRSVASVVGSKICTVMMRSFRGWSLLHLDLPRDALRAGLAAPAGNDGRLYAGIPACSDHEQILRRLYHGVHGALVLGLHVSGHDVDALQLGHRGLRVLEAIALDVFTAPAGLFFGCLVLPRN